MKIQTDIGEVELVDEPTFTFGSSDNVRSYPACVNLSSEPRTVSAHGVFLAGEPLVVLGAVGGATGIHEKSALWLNGRLYLAICDTVACIQLKPFKLVWSLPVDGVTCFGVHFHAETKSLLSHGELEISRFTETGKILWRAGGRDLFTGPFELEPEFISVEDFNGCLYRLQYATGKNAA